MKLSSGIQWLIILWLIAILAILLLIADEVRGGTIQVNYTRATEYVDGTPLEIQNIDYTQLYCDGEMVAQEAGADGTLEFTATSGIYVCTATHTANALESDHSEEKQIVVPNVKPKPPILEQT